ncbi:ArsR/SmtB family transcription factor [Streptomyces olindensis]|uniref:ArsR/SmtB family transcription factor n=1 Tax=Streptomyces olindensis TaxID=358823 RepID=UPI0033D4FC6B
MDTAPVEVIRASDQAITALDPVRSRLLAHLREPRSASGLARELGLPRQRVNYHLRQLEDQGLVVSAGERRWGGITERLVVATARAYVISPEAMGPAAPPEPGERPDRLSAAFLLALAAQTVRHLGSLLSRSRRTGGRVETFALQTDVTLASPAARADFARDLAAAVTGVVARYHDERTPGGRAHRLVIGAYPLPPTEEEHHD